MDYVSLCHKVPDAMLATPRQMSISKSAPTSIHQDFPNPTNIFKLFLTYIYILAFMQQGNKQRMDQSVTEATAQGSPPSRACRSTLATEPLAGGK